MVKGSDSNIGVYLAGASMVFGIILIADQVLSSYYGFSSFLGGGEINDEVFLFSVILHTTSAMLGGYLVGRRILKSFFQAAIIIAAIAYILESLYLRLFVGSLGDVWSLMSLIIGCIIGAMFAKVQKEKKTLHSRTINKINVKE